MRFNTITAVLSKKRTRKLNNLHRSDKVSCQVTTKLPSVNMKSKISEINVRDVGGLATQEFSCQSLGLDRHQCDWCMCDESSSTARIAELYRWRLFAQEKRLCNTGCRGDLILKLWAAVEFCHLNASCVTSTNTLKWRDSLDRQTH